MAVTVDEGEFAELAGGLGITPKEAVNTIMGRMKDLPWNVVASAKRTSLDTALGEVLDKFGIVYAWDEAIKEIVGERKYFVGDGGVDLRSGIFWCQVDLPEGDDSEIDGVHLQFGNDSGETVSASMDIVLNDGKLKDDALEEIYSEIDIVGPDSDHPIDFEYDYGDGNLSFCIVVHTDRDFDLPKFDEMNDLVRKIKEIVDGHHQLYALAEPDAADQKEPE